MSDTPDPAGMASLQDLIMQSLREVRAGSLDVSQAKAVNALAQTLINSAKVEVDFLRATNRKKSRFFIPSDGDAPERLTSAGAGVVSRVANGPWQGLVHRTRDDEDDA